MLFNIYEVDEESEIHNLNDDQIVEAGLSPGEMRQALLDRLRMEIADKNIDVVNHCLNPFDLFIVKKKIKNKSDRTQAVQDVEEVLYAADDEQFDDSLWAFSDEIIYVVGVEE